MSRTDEARQASAFRACALLGVEPARVEALSGGGLSAVARLALTDGRTVVAKGGPAPRVEAAMLRALADAGAPCPQVLAVDDAALALSDLGPEARLDPAGWRAVGETLRRLHARHGPRYGWDDDYAFDHVVIDNAWTDDWPRFWAERRLTRDLERVPPPLARRVERLAASLPERLPTRPAPSLLHGDLWVGNVFAARNGAHFLIDPACYYGHAEVDLAMLTLFGAPDAGFFEGYGPLDPGAPQCRPIYQLWPALVHLRLFGAGYAGLVERLLDAAGG